MSDLQRDRGTGDRGTRWIVGGLLSATLLLLLVLGPAWANGGTLRLANVPMGDYRVSVFTDPTPVRPDSVDVSLLIMEEGELGVAEGVDVQVRARSLDDPSYDRTLRATREQADDPRYYAVKMALGLEGPWEIGIRVSGPAGEGEASFEITAREAGLLGHPAVLILLAILPLALVGAWILREEEAPEVETPEVE